MWNTSPLEPDGAMRSARGLTMVWLGLGSLSVVILLLPLATLAADCAGGKPLYIPVETARQALGLRGETRARFLDRRYGAWEEDRHGRIRIETPLHGAPLTVHVAPIAEAGVRIELVVESRVEYIGSDERTVWVTGHRPIGSYEVAADEAATLTVPRDVFREPGALIAVVATQGMRGARQYTVGAKDVALADCARRIYVEDRFAAIRLNKAVGR